MASSKSLNDTSSKFDLPSEFKKEWEKMANDQLMDSFGDLYDNVELLVPMVDCAVKATQILVSQILDLKIQNV
jgi:hypothetical protein